MTDKQLKIIATLGDFCHQHRLTLATAESCSGGGIAFALSKSTRASSILERGYVTYSNPAKESLLHVKADSIQLHGAVSEVVATEMAAGALHNSIAQVSLASTGLAGEDNDLAHNEGIAWLAIARIDKKIITKKLSFKGARVQFMDYVLFQSLVFLAETLGAA